MTRSCIKNDIRLDLALYTEALGTDNPRKWKIGSLSFFPVLSPREVKNKTRTQPTSPGQFLNKVSVTGRKACSMAMQQYDHSFDCSPGRR